MSDSLGGGRRRHALAGPGQERPAGCRQHDPRHPLRLVEIEHLEDRVMLGIDREQGRAAAPHLGQDEIAGADQAFLVGQRDDRPLPDCAQRGLQTGGADNASHHPVDRPGRRFGDRLRARRRLDARSGKPVFQRRVQGRVGDRGQLRAGFARLPDQPCDVTVSGQRLDRKAIRLARHEIQRALADRAGRAEDRDAPGAVRSGRLGPARTGTGPGRALRF